MHPVLLNLHCFPLKTHTDERSNHPSSLFFLKKLFTQMFKNVEFPSLYSKGYKTGLVVSTHLA